MGQVMDLGYDEVRILVAPEDVSVLFVRIHALGAPALDDGGASAPTDTGTSEDYPLKLTYRLLGEGVPNGGRVDLTQEDDNQAQRGVLSRQVANDPRSTFPPLVRGTLGFTKPLDANAHVQGDFHVTFANGTEAASGRTAFGTFTAQVQP